MSKKSKEQYLQDLQQSLNGVLNVLPSLRQKKKQLIKETKQLLRQLKQSQINYDTELEERLKAKRKAIISQLNTLAHQEQQLIKQKQFLTAEIHAWKRASIFASPKVFKMEDHPLVWNYRLLAHQNAKGVQFRIHEVQYLDGLPCGYMGGKGFHSWEEEEDFKVIEETMNNMKNAIFKPILWAGEQFPNEYKK